MKGKTMSKIGAIVRWSAWAASLSKRHRRLGSRTAGLSAVLAKPRAAGRSVHEHWTFSTRTLRPRINLAIQPLLRFDLRPVMQGMQGIPTSQVFHQHLSVPPPAGFELNPAAAATQILHWMTRHESAERRSFESRSLIERFRQVNSSSVHIVEPAPLRTTPLSLVLQRLREPERALTMQKNPLLPGTTARPEVAPSVAKYLADKVRRTEKLVVEPAARVLREEAPELRKSRALAESSRESAAPDSWRGMPSASFPASVPGMPMAPQVNVEALTETVMNQIDQRLHAWRERRGGF
jgi:hypothetical protein